MEERKKIAKDSNIIYGVDVTNNVTPVMVRGNNTDANGNIFKSSIVDAVWEKGQIMEDIDPDYVRGDVCRTSIAKGDYGKTDKYGWEIDHIKPVAKGGTDDLSNLQPLQWENNRAKGDKYPWKC